MDEVEKTTSDVTRPIIIDLGSQKSKLIRELKKGEGKLWAEVQSVVEEVQDMLAEKSEGKVIVPVVMIYQKKVRRQRLDKLVFPFRGLRL